ncbi:MAG: glycoside hydrolase family 32 protein [Candidatus Neomarinimicrobiota bacterium]|nr:MAG: glycoside hydrolase family 32 protein [Candidatus Neomarinimicrobiota bacterium]
MQCLAYSTDRGRTWQKYSGNPVLDIGSNDFRDPSVFWHESTSKWIMVVALPSQRKVSFYGSPNLKNWIHLSDFGNNHEIVGGCECPDFFPLAVDGNPNNVKWVLEVDVDPGHPTGFAGGQYLIGDFDGMTFTVEDDSFEIPYGYLIEDFESDDYGNWIVTGTAFGTGPAHGSFSNQLPVTGFIGSGFVNSYLNGDQSRGTLTSPEFCIVKDFINFLIGGGYHPGQTCINLIVNSNVVRTMTGQNSEYLDWRSWDVSEFRGEDAKIQIVDDHSGSWGHINIDHIILSDEVVELPSDRALWVDYGKDFYAVRSWSGIPEYDGRRIWIAWMGTVMYGWCTPTSPWRNAQTIPRNVALKTFAEGIRIVQNPVRELKNLRCEHFRLSNQIVTENNTLLLGDSINRNAVEIKAKFELSTASEFGIKVHKGDNEETIIGYDVTTRNLFIDRSHSGLVNFHPEFPGVHLAPLLPDLNCVKLQIFVDWSSIEVFGNDGKVVITDLIFPNPNNNEIEVYAKTGDVILNSIDIWTMKSIWDGVSTMTEPESESSEVFPSEIKLYQNYPNPFNPTTRIQFFLPLSQHVSLTIYNLLGMPIRTLLDQKMQSGMHIVRWDGTNKFGQKVSSGVYLYRLHSSKDVKIGKMLLMG